MKASGTSKAAFGRAQALTTFKIPEGTRESKVWLCGLQPLVRPGWESALLRNEVQPRSSPPPKSPGATSTEIPRPLPGLPRNHPDQEAVSSSNQATISPTDAIAATTGWTGGPGNLSSSAQRSAEPLRDPGVGGSSGAFRQSRGSFGGCRPSRPSIIRAMAHGDVGVL